MSKQTEIGIHFKNGDYFRMDYKTDYIDKKNNILVVNNSCFLLIDNLLYWDII